MPKIRELVKRKGNHKILHEHSPMTSVIVHEEARSLSPIFLLGVIVLL